MNTYRSRFRAGLMPALAALTFLVATPVTRGQRPIFMAMGDSLGAGVQSSDASYRTQSNSYHAVLARQVGLDFPLPLVQSSFLGRVLELDYRSRIDPSVVSPNLSVAGHTLGDLVRLPADAVFPSQIDSETDLMLFPKLGSQLQIAEFLRPLVALCWIGNNDVLNTVISFDQLDASQLTSEAQFAADFKELVQRMNAAGITTMYGTIPDVASIAYLMGPEDLTFFTGSDQGLAAGEFTTWIAMVLIRLGIEDSSLFDDPNWLLDAGEIATIRQCTDTFNNIIRTEAAAVGMPVLDTNQLFADIIASPPTFAGVTLQRRFNGGLFSLDGVHASNTGYALVAREALNQFNLAFDLGLPPITDAQINAIAVADPFVDKDGDGVVTGRLGAGLFETINFFLGFSGDFFDFRNPFAATVASTGAAYDHSLFKRFALPSGGVDNSEEARAADRAYVIALFKEALKPR